MQHEVDQIDNYDHTKWTTKDSSEAFNFDSL